MAIGSFIGNVAGKLLGSESMWGAGAQLAGAGWDAYQANRTANKAQDTWQGAMQQDTAAYRQAMDMQHTMNQWQMQQYGQQRNDIQQQYGMARRDADFSTQLGLTQGNAQTAERLAMRDRLLNQTSHMGAAMRQAYDHLGMPYRPGQDEVQRDYRNIRDNHFGALDRLVQNSTSRTQAGAIARGMDNSTQHRDQQADWVRQFTPQYREADQTAFDQSVNRANSQQNLFQTGRNNFMSEMESVMGAQFERERGLYNNQYTAPTQATLASSPGTVGAPNLSADGYFRYNPTTSGLQDHADSTAGAMGDYWNRLGESATGFGTAAKDWWGNRDQQNQKQEWA